MQNRNGNFEGLNHRRVVVEIIAGGACKLYTLASQADFMVLVDAANELAKIPNDNRIIKVSLGANETALTLLSRLKLAGFKEVDDIFTEYNQRPNINLGAGMAQDPRLGTWAIKDLVVRGSLAKILEQILLRILEVSNAEVSEIVVRELNSNAGGTGSGSNPEFTAQTMSYLQSRTNAKIIHQVFRIGAATFATVAPKALLNTGQTTTANLNSLSSDLDPRRTHDMDIFELPLRNEIGHPLGDKTHLRDILAATALQARLSNSVETLIDAREVNNKTAKYTNIRRLKTAWSNSVDDELLQRAAAAHLQNQFQVLNTTQASQLSDEAISIEIEAKSSSVPLLPAKEILDLIRAGRLTRDLCEKILNTPLSEFLVHLAAHNPHLQSALNLDPSLESNATPDFHTAKDRISSSQIAYQILSQLLSLIKNADQQNKLNLDKARTSLQKRFQRCNSYLHQFDLLRSTPKAVYQHIEACLLAFYDAHQTHGHSQAKIAALEKLLAKITDQLDLFKQSSAKVINSLVHSTSATNTNNSPNPHHQFVQFQDLAPYYDEASLCLQRGSLDDHRHNKRSILKSAKITLKGIAYMTNSDPNPYSIIRALVDDRYPAWRSPLWGGEFCDEEPRYHLIVLPPMPESDFADLQRAARDYGFRPTLTMADTMEAGCCIVSLKFYPVSKLEDVLPPLYLNIGQSFSLQDDQADADTDEFSHKN